MFDTASIHLRASFLVRTGYNTDRNHNPILNCGGLSKWRTFGLAGRHLKPKREVPRDAVYRPRRHTMMVRQGALNASRTYIRPAGAIRDHPKNKVGSTILIRDLRPARRRRPRLAEHAQLTQKDGASFGVVQGHRCCKNLHF